MIRVLVIDDEPNIRLLLQEILKIHQYEVDVSPTGRHGIVLLQEQAYDLIFLDSKMPELDGAGTLKEIRKLSPVPVYLISAFQSAQEKERFMSLGATGILTKPFTIEEVVNIAEKHT